MTPTPEKQEDWRSEFDRAWELFPGGEPPNGFHIGCYECENACDKDALKSFISRLLSKERERARVENMAHIWPCGYPDCPHNLTNSHQKEGLT